jgi:D-glycero-alpha-D-manno-heptose-7-phosphate kinase
MIISQTPLRLSFLGGGSDLPAYYRRKGGGVLSTTIDKCIYVTVSRKFDNAVRVSYSRTEEVTHASRVEHPLVREAMGMLGIEGGVEITSVADIPAKGTGLGSSSSFTVGLLNALHAYCGRHASADRLAAESCHIEIDRCGEPIGRQDQYAAAFGGLNFIRFHPDDSVEVQKVICPHGTMESLEEQLLVFYTGVTRSASGVLAEQSANLASTKEKIVTVDRMVKSAEAALADLQSGRIDGIGEALHESWCLKKSLAAGISTPLIDDAYEAARNAGAVGGKILGAGGGGFLILLAPPERHQSIRLALACLRETPFRFSKTGSRIIFVH